MSTASKSFCSSDSFGFSPTLALVFISTPSFWMYSMSLLEDVPRHAVLRDAHADHAAGLRERLEDGHLMAGQGQVVRCRQTGRTGADDGHLLAGLGDLGDRQSGDVVLVRGKPLERADGQRLVDVAPLAGLLAGMEADAAQNRRQGVGAPDQLVGFLELAGGDQGQVTLDIHVDRAGGLAGRRLPLVNDVLVGHGLRERDVDGLALPHPHVEVAEHFHRDIPWCSRRRRCTS